MKSVIFLDIDGVLNSKLWEKKHSDEIKDKKLIDIEAVKILSRIVESTGAIIVLHSGWRFWFDESMNPINREAQYFVDVLKEEGIQLNGVTPDLTTEEIRRTKKFSSVKADEILLWLKNNPNYKSWLVLDDLDLNNTEVRKHQVKTNSDVGITEMDIEKAKIILNIDK